MNVVADASALLAVLLQEEDWEAQQSKLDAAEKIWISPINWWEVQVRMRSIQGADGERVVAKLFDSQAIEVADVSAATAKLAFEAFQRFSGRPARLNMGDCFAYALAKQKDLPLLFKGNDFAATDVKVA